jgi:hypothetical protein
VLGIATFDMLVHGPGSDRRYPDTAADIQIPLQRSEASQLEGTRKSSSSIHHSLAKRTSFKHVNEPWGTKKAEISGNISISSGF